MNLYPCSTDALRTALALYGHSLKRTEVVPHVLRAEGRVDSLYQVLVVVCEDPWGREDKRADLFDRSELGDPDYLRLWVRCHYPDLLADHGLALLAHAPVGV